MDASKENLSYYSYNLKMIKICNANKLKEIYIIIKRILDIILSVIGIIVLLPIFVIIAILIKMSSKGNILFKHKRMGKNGKEIYIYKFRTMLQNSEDLIKSFDSEQMKEYKEKFKLESDPRITRIGRVLRKTSLDELPQLLNIIKGELSIIGPRPITAEELEKVYDKEKLLSVTPGLTGYWAANGRSNTTYSQRIEMELYYVDNISIKLDIKIFFKTIISVLKQEGAI